MDSQKKFEHNYLRDEIKSNKRLVFERALLIAGFGLVTTFLPAGDNDFGFELLGLPAIGALAFNLWFTLNRLKSNMRIIAYVQLFHESNQIHNWIGWENALRANRIWQHECKNEVKKVKAKCKNIPQSHNFLFYTPILYLHIVMFFTIAIFMFLRSCLIVSSIDKSLSYVMLAINGLAAVALTIWALIYYRPINIKCGVERNRLFWLAIFKSLKEGKLSELVKDNELQ